MLDYFIQTNVIIIVTFLFLFLEKIIQQDNNVSYPNKYLMQLRPSKMEEMNQVYVLFQIVIFYKFLNIKNLDFHKDQSSLNLEFQYKVLNPLCYLQLLVRVH